jgi:hypothetical protein
MNDFTQYSCNGLLVSAFNKKGIMGASIAPKEVA